MPALFANWFRHTLSTSTRSLIVLVFFLLLAMWGGYAWYGTTSHQLATPHSSTPSSYIAFTEDVFDIILSSYWNSVDETALSDFYRRIAEQLTGQTLSLEESSRDGLMAELETLVARMPDGASRRDFVVKLAANALQGLEPVGRSILYTTKAAQDLSRRVQHIDTQANLYGTLGVTEDASTSTIAAASAAKKRALGEQDLSNEAVRHELAAVTYAEEVLGDEQTKERYDSIGALPTVYARVLPGHILYVFISQFSPSTYNEFVHALEKTGADAKNGLILDLRGNIGGSLDIVPPLLGLFIGAGNDAIALFSKEVLDPIPATGVPLDMLESYKRIAVLVDSGTQSSAEVFASALKRYNAAVIFGLTTRGWGTVERLFPIEHQLPGGDEYGVFLVHSITLRDDNQPIEGRGVKPDVRADNEKWEEELRAYWNDETLIHAIKTAWDTPTPTATY